MITYFDRVVLINLRRRPDRLEKFRRRQRERGWPLPEPLVFPAVDGGAVGVPGEFTQGGGAYGCRQSHCHVLEQALTDGVQRLLVFEDDADWREDFGPRLEEFLSAVPLDWEQLVLGGQHHRSPSKVNERVVKVRFSQRTHAYALTPSGMRSLLALWRTTNVHIDWVMGDWQRSRRVYAPSDLLGGFLVGQDEGKSDISGRLDRKRWWNRPRAGTPVVVLEAPVEVARELRRQGWHTGFDQSGDYAPDIAEAAKHRDRKRLLQSVESLLGEIASDDRLEIACLYHPELDYAWVKSLRPHAIRVCGSTVEECAAQVAHPWYSMSGDAGDIIAMLPSLQHLGGGKLRLFPSGLTSKRMTPALADNLRPLLETCSYLSAVEFGEVPWGVNLDGWREHYRGHLNLADMMAEWLGLPHSPRDEPWLRVMPRKAARFVFNRTPRYHGKDFPWREVVRLYGTEGAFVGLPHEHRAFCREFGDVPRLETASLLDVAEIVAGSELVVCNQSSTRWICEGLKHPVIVEQGEPKNTHFERLGARYDRLD